jgi:putative FmdB family regulatory protein
MALRQGSLSEWATTVCPLSDRKGAEGYTSPAMPTYQYLCRDCDHEFEAVQSMRDDPLTICPSCGGSLRKVYAPPAISFKGSGFYATDHGKRKPAAATSDGAEKPEKKATKADKASETSPKRDSSSTKEAATT